MNTGGAMQTLDQINTRAKFTAINLVNLLNHSFNAQRVMTALESAYLSGYAASNADQLESLRADRVRIDDELNEVTG
jgi:hypothetical protein